MEQPELDQDVDSTDDDASGSENNDQSNQGTGDTAPTYKVGDKEYTADQIASLEKAKVDYDNLLPEFTRKSQDLAKFEKGQNQASDNQGYESPLNDPNYQPKDYKQFREDLHTDFKARQAHEDGIRTQQETEVKQQVDTFMTEVASKNPNFNRKDFESYAAKPGFRIDTVDDMRAVFERYTELQEAGKGGDKKVVDDKVTTSDSGGQTGPSFDDLRIKGGSVFDKVTDAYKRLSGKQ